METTTHLLLSPNKGNMIIRFTTSRQIGQGTLRPHQFTSVINFSINCQLEGQLSEWSFIVDLLLNVTTTKELIISDCETSNGNSF